MYYAVTGHLGRFVVHAETPIRAIQSAILERGGFARDWKCVPFDTYPHKDGLTMIQTDFHGEAA